MTRRGQASLLIIAAVAIAALLFVAIHSPRLVVAGWLLAVTFLSAIPLGALTWLMVHRLTGGHWGDCLRPTFETAALTIPLLVVLVLPLLVALRLLYPWAEDSSAIKPDVAAFYLNTPLFILRAGIALIGWSLLAIFLPRARAQTGLLLAGAGLVFYAVMVSLLSADWILSVEPAFISTSFGATVAITQMMAALAFAALLAPRLDEDAVRDLAGLMLTLTLGLTYLNFMAALVIWYGNLPDKVVWFVQRQRGPWIGVAIAIFILGSVIPTLMLLLERVRRSRVALRLVACSSLVGIALFDAWLLAPPYGVGTLGTGLLAAVAIACVAVVVVHNGRPAVLLDRARAAS